MMSYGRKESPWLVFRRCLAIARRLVRGPASGQELIAFVRARIDARAYSQEPAAARSAFKRDRGHLRHKLV